MNERGAHCKGHNTGSIGICVLGLDVFNIVQMKSLAGLCTTLRAVYGLGNIDIVGHNKYNDKKLCPVFDVDRFIKDYMDE